MNKRQLGNTGIYLSEIGLGCMGMSTSYGIPDDRESLQTLQRALALGVNYFDTADIYADGKNEELISQVIAPVRNKVFISTKVGFRKGNDGKTYVDESPVWIKEAIDGSLKRLKTDAIDLYYMHRIDPKIPVEESVGALSELVQQGKIRYIGLSECSANDLRKANAVHAIAAVQSEYSIVERQVEQNGILALTKEIGSAFIPFAPLGRGLVTNALDMKALQPRDFRYNIPRYQGTHRDNNQKLAIAISEYARRNFDATASQLALAWLLAQSDHIIPIPGTKRRQYLEENVSAADISLTKRQLGEIQEILDCYPNVGERYAKRQQAFVNQKKE